MNTFFLNNNVRLCTESELEKAGWIYYPKAERYEKEDNDDISISLEMLDQFGTNIISPDKVLEYDEDEHLWEIEDEDGYSWYISRDMLMVMGE